MGRVRYVKSMRDLEREQGSDSNFLQGAVRSIRCVYETDAEVAQAVVPKPLEASVRSEVCVSFSAAAMQVSPDVTIEIRSASFGVRVDYDDKPGSYLLTMPATSEQAVVVGRALRRAQEACRRGVRWGGCSGLREGREDGNSLFGGEGDACGGTRPS